jgi:hypothetical protein
MPGDLGTVETTSDAGGQFTFVSLPVGEVMAFADVPGLATKGLFSATFEGFNPFATTVSSFETASVDVVLVPAGLVSGRVFDPDGRPLAGAIVSVRPSRSAQIGGPEPSSPLPPWKAKTAEDGSFRFDTLPPKGVYDFEAVSEGRHAGWVDGVEVPGPLSG